MSPGNEDETGLQMSTFLRQIIMLGVGTNFLDNFDELRLLAWTTWDSKVSGRYFTSGETEVFCNTRIRRMLFCSNTDTDQKSCQENRVKVCSDGGHLLRKWFDLQWQLSTC